MRTDAPDVELRDGSRVRDRLVAEHRFELRRRHVGEFRHTKLGAPLLGESERVGLDHVLLEDREPRRLLLRRGVALRLVESLSERERESERECV